MNVLNSNATGIYIVENACVFRHPDKLIDEVQMYPICLMHNYIPVKWSDAFVQLCID